MGSILCSRRKGDASKEPTVVFITLTVIFCLIIPGFTVTSSVQLLAATRESVRECLCLLFHLNHYLKRYRAFWVAYVLFLNLGKKNHLKFFAILYCPCTSPFLSHRTEKEIISIFKTGDVRIKFLCTVYGKLCGFEKRLRA